MAYFKGKQFKQDIIMVAVGYYLRYNLSYLDILEILRERGIDVCIQLFTDGVKNIVESPAAYAFFKRLIKQLGELRDKAPSLDCAFR